jgi:hypothetical protein
VLGDYSNARARINWFAAHACPQLSTLGNPLAWRFGVSASANAGTASTSAKTKRDCSHLQRSARIAFPCHLSPRGIYLGGFSQTLPAQVGVINVRKFARW